MLLTQGTLSLIIVVLAHLCVTVVLSNCNTESLSTGCVDCTAGNWLVFNRSSNKYDCISVSNCVVVVGNKCVGCGNGTIIDSSTGTCVVSIGCVLYNNSACVQCQSTNYFLSGGVCYPKSIHNCIQYTVGTLGNVQCTKCISAWMDAQLNCTLNSSQCSVFDYQLGRCLQCPNNTYIHSDGVACYSPQQHCQVYSVSAAQSSCLRCIDNYIYNTLTGQCVLSYTSGIKYQILVYNLNSSNSSSAIGYQYMCILNNYVIDELSFTCTAGLQNHCLVYANAGTKTCASCVNGYYLSNSTCIQCISLIQNCLLCRSASGCTSCVSGYYVLQMSVSDSKCMPCSAYKCKQCTIDPTSISGRVFCISCPINSTLYNGLCYQCNTASSAYSITQSKCIPCNSTIAYCRFCTFTASLTDNPICLQCQQPYYYNGSTCLLIDNTTVVTLTTAKQILQKSAPGIEMSLYNNRLALMSMCYTVDGYVCNCTNTNTTSLCTSYLHMPNLSQLVFSTYLQVVQHGHIMRMASQFNTFSYQTQMPYRTLPYQPLTQEQFYNVLATLTNVMMRSQGSTEVPTNTTKDALIRIMQHSLVMGRAFSDRHITIIRGNGFYYKHIPVGLKSGSTGDDDYISTSLGSTNPIVIYIRYSRIVSSGFVTGTIYIHTTNTNAFSVRLRKTRHANNNGNTTLRYDGNIQNNLTANLSDGYFTIANFPKFTTSAPNGVQIYIDNSDSTVDIYQTQRIQNIFYSESWLYVLFFIALYLIFLPLCAIVDCCQTQHIMRKKVGTDQNSGQPDSQDQTIVRVNYRDFFPLYNCGNTPRPRRLMKVCLFIVNMQHIITFLTLIYFNLAGGQPVVAIILVIPAYICTVIMGYIVGSLFRILPGNMKYLINLFSLGYWILWILLMRIMNNQSSRQYRLYILVFTILSFFLDMVIDSLETLLVYFAIKQEEKQVSLFNCLAKWLSFRGYYQFDKLAKQLGDPSQ